MFLTKLQLPLVSSTNDHYKYMKQYFFILTYDKDLSPVLNKNSDYNIF